MQRFQFILGTLHFSFLQREGEKKWKKVRQRLAARCPALSTVTPKQGRLTAVVSLMAKRRRFDNKEGNTCRSGQGSQGQ
jgi:hypothetical protein